MALWFGIRFSLFYQENIFDIFSRLHHLWPRHVALMETDMCGFWEIKMFFNIFRKKFLDFDDDNVQQMALEVMAVSVCDVIITRRIQEFSSAEIWVERYAVKWASELGYIDFVHNVGKIRQ